MSWNQIIKKYGLGFLLKEVTHWMIRDRKVTYFKVRDFLIDAVNTKLIGSGVPTFKNKKNYDKLIVEVQKWVKNNIHYKSDQYGYGVKEYWATPKETMIMGTGDCIAEYEEIYTKNGIKSAKDVKEGDLVLSYDFKKKKFIYRPIVKKWDKGKLQIKRVHFRNGQHIDVTDNHHMMVRKNQQGKSIYEQKNLKDIDLTKWWKRKVPIAKKIPYIKSKPIWNKDLYRVIGHYLAEGYSGKYVISSSGYELLEYIIPILEKNNIPFTEFKNNSNVPCIRFLNSNFKNYLKPLKRNSFDITLTEELLTLPKEYLEELLYGMWLGDGTKFQYKDKRGYANNKEWTYSTSSKQLAADIQRIGLYLGRTFHIWKQEKHGGVGDQPIYRINYNSNSHFLKNHGYKNLGEVSILYVEDLGKYQTYDWEVQDTHNFVFKNGIITFQCEDGGSLIYTLARQNGIPPTQIALHCGNVKWNGTTGGHCWVEYYSPDLGENYIIDWCYYPNTAALKDRLRAESDERYVTRWWDKGINDIKFEE